MHRGTSVAQITERLQDLPLPLLRERQQRNTSGESD